MRLLYLVEYNELVLIFAILLQWDIVKSKGKYMLDKKFIGWTTEKWESICDLKTIFKFSLGEPACLESWNEDRWFGLQRIQGVNPVLIKLCTKIPEK